jgi:hypothetical protein
MAASPHEEIGGIADAGCRFRITSGGEAIRCRPAQRTLSL